MAAKDKCFFQSSAAAGESDRISAAFPNLRGAACAYVTCTRLVHVGQQHSACLVHLPTWLNFSCCL